MATIDVDPRVLFENGRVLHALEEDLGYAHHRVEGLRSHDLGSRSLDGALNHFADHWEYGMNRMRARVKATGDALIVAARTYEQVDGLVATVIPGP